MSLQAIAMLIAVSCLSPVITHTCRRRAPMLLVGYPADERSHGHIITSQWVDQQITIPIPKQIDGCWRASGMRGHLFCEVEVTSHLHAGVEEGLDGGGNAVLQLVLDGRHAHQLQVCLHLQHTQRRYLAAFFLRHGLDTWVVHADR